MLLRRDFWVARVWKQIKKHPLLIYRRIEVIFKSFVKLSGKIEFSVRQNYIKCNFRVVNERECCYEPEGNSEEEG